MPIAREALPFVLPPLVAAVLFAVFSYYLPAILLLVVASFALWFFRDPRREFLGPPETLVAAADGRVTVIDRVVEPALGEGEHQRVVTFLSAFNVHVQRCPTAGEVVAMSFAPGRKVAAFRSDADQVNESHLTVLRESDSALIGVRQIVGLLARRIVPYLSVGDRVERCDRLGIIKFGSRVDLIVPSSYRILVAVGDRLEAGTTPVAVAGESDSLTGQSLGSAGLGGTSE